MRFLCVDKIVGLDLERRVLAEKTVTLSDEFLTWHYSRVAVMPASLMLECVAQAGGWLYIASRKFRLMPVFTLAEEIQVARPARQGEKLTIEVWNDYAHDGGATMHGEVRSADKRLLTIRRLVYFAVPAPGERQIQQLRDQFAYVSGGHSLSSEERP